MRGYRTQPSETLKKSSCKRFTGESKPRKPMWITPLSIRSAFFLESGCSTKDCMPDLDTWASEAARSCTLNGRLTQSASWKRGWKKEAYLQRLYGSAICANSTQASFTAWWIASLLASRVKTSVWPDGGLGLTASEAACFLKSSGLPVIAVRDTSFWRTSQASLLPPPPLWTKPKALLTNAQPPASWENWPTTGGMRSGSLFPRPTLEPATGGQGGFAGHGETWLTPNVPNGGQAVSPELVASKGMTEDGQKRTVGLESQSRYWTTPDVCSGARDMSKIDPEAQKRGNTKRTTGLPTEAQNWPTPAARDAKGENSLEHCTETGGGEETHGSTEQLCRPLFAPGPADPAWPGIIRQWPHLAPALEPSFHMLADGLAYGMDDCRPQRLKCCGNGVVAAQAGFALVWLVQRMNK